MKDSQSKIFHANLPLLIVGQDQKPFLEILKKFKNDSLLLEGKRVKILDIRGLIKWLSLRPTFGDYKLVIILDAEKINSESANALLKTLEEPPSYARIVLLTSDEKKILPTIHSRCLKIRFFEKVSFPEPEGYLSPEIISQKSIKERFKWADEISESEEVDKILILWQEHFRKKLLGGEDVLEILKFLERARDLLSTNISVKLLLGNLVINFDEEL